MKTIKKFNSFVNESGVMDWLGLSNKNSYITKQEEQEKLGDQWLFDKVKKKIMDNLDPSRILKTKISKTTQNYDYALIYGIDGDKIGLFVSLSDGGDPMSATFKINDFIFKEIRWKDTLEFAKFLEKKYREYINSKETEKDIKGKEEIYNRYK